MELYVEQLIIDELSSISNTKSRNQRERSLRAYYENPNYCQHCGELILFTKNMLPSDVRDKKFCNRSCSAAHNNAVVLRDRMRSFVDMCSDEEFVNAYNNSGTYKQLGESLGYAVVGSSVIQKIKTRMNALCLQEYRSAGVTPVASMTKGELIRSRSNWQSWRSTIQKMARSVYENSDNPKRCIVCGYDKTYQVAHIKAVSEFNDTDLVSEINNADNLSALCPNHHWEYDHNLLSIGDYL